MSHHCTRDTNPELIFTRDFREYIRGRFRPGLTATIRYDPYRVVPPRQAYRFGDPDHAVVAHLQCSQGGPILDVTLGSPAGIPDWVPSADFDRALMLRGEVVIPVDAAWVTVWFTYKSAGGQVFYDSNFGKNFRLRFYRDELEILQTDVLDDLGQSQGRFVCRVAANACVQRVIARYRVVNRQAAAAETSVDLRQTGESDEHGHPIWATEDVLVPKDGVIAYDLVYFADDRAFKDNNQGNYFLAYDPRKRERKWS
jgi:hypothetical protein